MVYWSVSKKTNKNKKIIGNIRITPKPLGFLDTEDGNSVIVFEENLNCALDKDEVEIEIIGGDRNRKKGRVVRVLKRNKTNFVGTIEKIGKNFVFSPDDFRFYKNIELRSYPEDIKSGSKVFVKIRDWKNPNLNPEGDILKIIGKAGEHETEMQSILIDKGIVYDFSPDVEREAISQQERFFSESPRVSLLTQARLSSQNFPAGTERVDFRNIMTFTIDPVDAKDFDDALSYEDLGDGKIRVGVHIADVSHFVKPGTALDREARERSFSTYLVDRTIPMLPEVLSNGICSLMPNVDRFAFSAVFDIKKDTGEILERWFGKTIINSDKRFSYEEAQDILDKVNSEKSSSSESPQVSSSSPVSSGAGEARLSSEDFFLNSLSELNRIAKIYREENKKNGAIEFETDEVRFELDEKGRPIRVYKKPRLDSMKMIEDWMLLANREVAKFISDKVKKFGGVGLFRVHDLPNMDKLEELSIFVNALGHHLPIRGGYISAKDLNILLSEIEGHTSESLIKTAALRSMAKAQYSTKNIGHYGLAFEYYTHFTSPIRRYPDILVHRIIDSYLNKKPISKKEFSKFEKIAKEASEKEIVIAEAERSSIRYKQVEYMQNKVGEVFDCVISGVTERGIYVEDPLTKSEGMVRLRNMKEDNFVLDQKNYCVIGANTGKKYSLGDDVKVKLISADMERKTLDFKLI